MQIRNPRQYVVGQWPKRVRSLAWQLHCARNVSPQRAPRFEAALRQELALLGVEPEVEQIERCPTCGVADRIWKGSDE